MKLKIAVSQFPVSTNIAQNMRYISRQIKEAAKSKVEVIHFPELALSGYQTEIAEIDWNLLDKSMEDLKTIAAESDINIVIGVHQPSSGNRNPFNATCLITDKGKIAGHYIKSRLYGKEKEKFENKENSLVYDIKGVKCGFLICYDSNFPSFFQDYKNAGVEVLFISFYNANSSKPKNSMDELMRAQFITRSTDSLMYISGSNSSSRYSRMPSSFVCPDGTITSLKRHQAGILICEYPKADLGWTFTE